MQTILTFHSELYPLEALEITAREFADQASITIERDGAYHRVVVSAAAPVEVRALAHEIANYALAVAASRSAAEPGEPAAAPPTAGP